MDRTAHRLIPSDENYRLHILSEAKLLDSPPEPAFDTLVVLARRLTDAPVALISLVDAERQWFKARCGIAAKETPRDISFCDHAIAATDIMIVEDASADPRFAQNPMVTGAEKVRFYAGVPLRLNGRDGGRSAAIGTLCVIDTVPRTLNAAQIEALHDLARMAETLIEGRRLAIEAVEQAHQQHWIARQLAHEQSKFSQAERMAGLGYWRLDLRDEALYWSDNVYAIHGLPVGKAPPLNAAFDFYPPHARAKLSAVIAQTIETGAPFEIETDFLTAQGELRRVRSIGEREDDNGVPVAVFGVFQDVTEQYRLSQVLRQSAHRDALTGLANRAACDEVLDDRILQARRNDTGMAVMLIDLDGFKAVNDAQGHMAGDELLQAVAARFRSDRYADCFIARLGGDEFVLVLDHIHSVTEMEKLARDILDDLSRPVVTPECTAVISGTIGIARLHADDGKRDLMRRADQALYAAKNSERGTARIHGSGRTIRATAAIADMRALA
ncbi:diguanylate cyclase domain-containing protein [Sphingobium algorifonticola]|uniref:Diguanylate cyclase n=1 Tax=Sphingobium algorifonticola TaxID=2008318 RepID=A0A437J631_9SPHN|nr:diguanylate cyclase [Sphingobium algorifonticola]RVT40243.1 diguanylate cyclase [Sphingobium algorifonticola]